MIPRQILSPHMMMDFLCFVDKQLIAAQILGLSVGMGQVFDLELTIDPSVKVRINNIHGLQDNFRRNIN